jgi:hypothetical protein
MSDWDFANWVVSSSANSFILVASLGSESSLNTASIVRSISRVASHFIAMTALEESANGHRRKGSGGNSG